MKAFKLVILEEYIKSTILQISFYVKSYYQQKNIFSEANYSLVRLFLSKISISIALQGRLKNLCFYSGIKTLQLPYDGILPGQLSIVPIFLFLHPIIVLVLF